MSDNNISETSGGNPICRNITNGHVWEWLGDMKFKDLTANKSYIVQDVERAKREIKISPLTTQLLNNYPNLKELINKLHLKMGEITFLPNKED